MGYLPYQLVSRISSINSRPRFQDSKNLVISFFHLTWKANHQDGKHIQRGLHCHGRFMFTGRTGQGFRRQFWRQNVLRRIYYDISCVHMCKNVYIHIKCPWSNKTCEQYSGPHSQKKKQKESGNFFVSAVSGVDEIGSTKLYNQFKRICKHQKVWRKPPTSMVPIGFLHVYSYSSKDFEETEDLKFFQPKKLVIMILSMERIYKDSFLAPLSISFSYLNLWSFPPVTTPMAGACFFSQKAVWHPQKGIVSAVALRIWIRAQPQVSSGNQNPTSGMKSWFVNDRFLHQWPSCNPYLVAGYQNYHYKLQVFDPCSGVHEDTALAAPLFGWKGADLTTKKKALGKICNMMHTLWWLSTCHLPTKNLALRSFAVKKIQASAACQSLWVRHAKICL